MVVLNVHSLMHFCRRLSFVWSYRLLPLLLASLFASRGLTAAPPTAANLGPGVNLGNALEAPRGANWGIQLEPGYFGVIRKGGFHHVRLPVRWSDYAAVHAPYQIEADFLQKVDGLLDEAQGVGLKVVLNIHHYEGMDQDPTNHVERWVAIWRQLAQHYRNRPNSLLFELLNEPHGQLTEDAWNHFFPRALAAVRETNPTRTVVVGPGNWNNIGALSQLKLPENDRHLLVTVHYYLPFPFTHQGAEWVKDSNRWMGRKWTGSDEENQALRKDLDGVAAWAKEHSRPIYVGEFGSYQKADADSRPRWTAAVARECERRGFDWAYWEFGAGFGVYDRETRQWREPLMKALFP